MKHSIRQILPLVAAAAALMAAAPAEARKFDLKSERFATYFRGGLGPSLLADDAYANSSGVGTTIDKEVQTNLSGELGFVFIGQQVNLRIGVEYLMPRDMLGVTGKNASAQELFSLNSKVSALMPMINLELQPYATASSKAIIGVGGGLAFVNMENAYKMTSQGTTELSVSDFTEKGQAQKTVLQAYLGFETHFTDTVTAMFDLGYRYLPLTTIKASQAVGAISGTYPADAELKNSDGSARSFNLGGLFAGLSFRFYLGL